MDIKEKTKGNTPYFANKECSLEMSLKEITPQCTPEQSEKRTSREQSLLSPSDGNILRETLCLKVPRHNSHKDDEGNRLASRQRCSNNTEVLYCAECHATTSNHRVNSITSSHVKCKCSILLHKSHRSIFPVESVH